MTAKFILSLDCEGKWGMADAITAYHDHHLTTAKLRDAYVRLLALFHRYELPVTFAFVMAFLLSDEEQREDEHLFPHCAQGVEWLRHFRAAQAADSLEGWTLPELLDLVQADARHEVACHGFSHLPLDGNTTPQASAAKEFAACRDVADRRGLNLETLVYPRNQIGHVSLLGKYGFRGFRHRLRRRAGRAGQLMALAAEWNVRQAAQPSPAYDPYGAIDIPSGFFFNWRVGARRLVPPAVTALRWKRMIDHAGEEDVVHLWLHPHNIITGPETYDVLERVLRNVADMRDRGRLETMTQADYCRDLNKVGAAEWMLERQSRT